MKLRTAAEIQNNFKAGLQICGEEDGELQWIGSKKEWEKYEEMEENNIMERPEIYE